MVDCIGCYWFNYTDCKCKNKNSNNGEIDKFCELFLPSQLFKDDCTNCTHSQEIYEKTPDGAFIPESMFHICRITGDKGGSERMSKYLESCLHHCGEEMTRQEVLNDPYCAGCEVYDILQTIEEHVQMKLDGWLILTNDKGK